MQKQLEVAATTPPAEEYHMKEIILQYVQEESSNPYALMISGPWGCGKTHYLTKSINEEIEKKSGKIILYVSVNGMGELSEILDSLSIAKILTNPHLKERIGEYLKGKHPQLAMKLLKSGGMFFNSIKIPGLNLLSFLNTSKLFDALKSTVQGFSDFSKNIIVIDDLERISPKIKHEEILGFINTNFVEHNRIKIIILCDEKQIKEKDDFKNIKEKVIGRTLEFKPKTLEVAKTHINGLAESPHKAFLKANEQFLLDRFKQAEITNLRTLFFFFDSLVSIVQSLEKGLLDSFGEEIILQTIMFSNEYKNGRLEKYPSFDELPDFFRFTRSMSFTALRVEEEKNKEKNKEKSDFKRRYSLNDGPTTPLIKEIHDYIRYGYLGSEKLQNQFKKRLESEHPPEIEAILKLNESGLQRISNEEFTGCVTTLIKYVSEKKYGFTNFLGAFVILHGFFKDGLLPIEGIETKSTEELNVLFTNNVASIRNSNPLTIPAHRENRTLSNFKNSYENLYPKLITALENEIKDYKDEHQRDLLRAAFTDFMSNPKVDSYWQSIGSFVQYFSNMLIKGLKDALKNSHSKAKDYGVAFVDWASEETYPKPFDRNETEQNFANILQEIKQFEKGLDYSQKPLNKYFNGYLIRALQLSYDKAQQLCTEEKEEKDRQQKEQSTT